MHPSIRYFLLTSISVVVLLTFLYIFRDVFIPLIIALILTYMLEPLVKKMIEKGISRRKAVYIIFGIIILLFIITMFLIIPSLIKESLLFIKHIPLYITKLLQNIESSTNYIKLHIKVKNIDSHLINLYKNFQKEIPSLLYPLLEAIQNSFKNLIGGFFSIFSLLTLVVLFPLYVFFFMIDLENISSSITSYIPLRYKKNLLIFLHEVNEILSAFFRGRLLIVVIISILSTLFLWIFSIRYSLLFGTLLGVSTLIPFSGIIVAIPMGILGFLDMGVKGVIIAILIYSSIQFIEGFILTPIILGNKMELHPITLIISFMIWGKILGFIGVLLAVPLTAIFKAFFKVYLSKYIKELVEW